jgi:hypothetical protein
MLGREEICSVNWKGRYGLYPVGLSKKGLLGCAQDAVHVADCIANLEANPEAHRCINPDSQIVAASSDGH